LALEALKVINGAFDAAWAEIAGNFDGDQTEMARLKLANAILANATEQSRDAEVLKRAGLAAMALDYRN